MSGRKIGTHEPCFIIGEAGCNHDGSVEKAFALIDVASAANVDAVKFQTFDAARLAARSSPKAGYQLETTSGSESQFEMLRKLELPPEAFAKLDAYARSKGLIFLSTPFDELSAELLFRIGVPAFKIGSGELSHLPFLRTVAAFGRPMLISTGMSYLGEIEEALSAVRSTGNDEVALFHATSAYPATAADANLRAMHTLEAAFEVPVGLSDHSIGTVVSTAAVALGACMIEKHFTLDSKAPGPDHRASLEPHDLASLVTNIRAVEVSFGSGRKEPRLAELDTRRVARRSIFAARDIRPGQKIEMTDLAILRPGTGITPSSLERVLAMKAASMIPEGTLIAWEMLT